MKNAGLSHLADTAREITGGDIYYPVGGPLKPNWPAIRWLEGEDFLYNTVITDSEQDAWEGDFIYHRARGWYAARKRNNICRQMFNVFHLHVHSTHSQPYRDPCSACLDFSRSWACKEHPEREYDQENFEWKENDHA